MFDAVRLCRIHNLNREAKVRGSPGEKVAIGYSRSIRNALPCDVISHRRIGTQIDYQVVDFPRTFKYIFIAFWAADRRSVRHKRFSAVGGPDGTVRT